MRYNPGHSLTTNLAAAGYTHSPAPQYGYRHIHDASGRVVFTGRYEEVAAWLKAQEAL